MLLLLFFIILNWNTSSRTWKKTMHKNNVQRQEIIFIFQMTFNSIVTRKVSCTQQKVGQTTANACIYSKMSYTVSLRNLPFIFFIFRSAVSCESFVSIDFFSFHKSICCVLASLAVDWLSVRTFTLQLVNASLSVTTGWEERRRIDGLE